MKLNIGAPVFDHKTLRLLLGIIAFALPFLVTWVARAPLASISASYFTEARDWFVGMLFIVGALMLAYNGHTTREALASKAAGLCAFLIALFPTLAKTCGDSTPGSKIHGIAAVVLFLILAYFCFGPFRDNTKGKGGKKGLRARLYFVCGCVMVACMLVGLGGRLLLDCETMAAWSITYWVEAVALAAFGVAWIVAGKIIPVLVDEQEALKLFRR
ncbi:MAG: hypothetical protein PVF46_01575 [Lysobacterales bacterium]|jgi:hypothetical protein